MFANLIVVGRLTRDATLKEVGAAKKTSIALACDVGYGEGKSTLWVDVEYWRRSENLLPYLKKGVILTVSGEPSLKDYKGKSYLKLRADTIRLTGGKNITKEPNDDVDDKPLSAKNDFDDDVPF